MRFFYQLLAIVIITLLAVLGWDLSKRRISHGGKEVIIYAGMFGPGEPMQLLYSGPPAGLAPEHPFGPDAADHYAALIQACPDLAQKIRDNYQAAFQRPLVVPAADDASLVEQYRTLDPGYIDKLVQAIGRKDLAQRLDLFKTFADLHPQYDRHLIREFHRLHPAYTVGLFEDFKRRHPQYDIEERWDGRYVLSANRPRFLTGSDVPDLVAGDWQELRILYREDLALPLDQPLPDARDSTWRTKGILYSPSCVDPNVPILDTFNAVALEASRYTISQQDVTQNRHSCPAGTRITYLWPNLVHPIVIFYNRAHFAKIGRDPDAAPRTVEEFEEICRQLLQAGIEPIAQDGVVYIEWWWHELAVRMLGYQTLLGTCNGDEPRFAGPNGDPRYLQIAQRLRRWRDQDFWMKQFSASKWPGAQRDFGAGKCTFLMTGTWLPAEIARTRSYDPKIFDLSCFIFPACPGGAGNQRSITANTQGHVITRQGKCHAGAAALLDYLSVYGSELQTVELHYISARKGIRMPTEMAALEPVFASARPDDIVAGGLPGDVPMCYKFVLMEAFSKFFPIRSDNLTPEELCQTLESKAQDLYTRYGKGP